jgi:hypothetical protein
VFAFGRSAVAIAACALAIGCASASADDESPSPPAAEATGATLGEIDFERHIAPLLREHCWKCHGQSRQEGDLRLDRRTDALRGGASGQVIVPGRSSESPLFARITSTSTAERMPAEAEPLPAEAIDLLRNWIDSGAAWPLDKAETVSAPSQHWAYIKPQRPAVPAVSRGAWCRNSIDAFILSRLESQGLPPADEVSRERLIRRVTLDLTGLPPTLDEIDAFLADEGDAAYERLVDRLLASPAYGERWAIPWLDAARHADSHGFQQDGARTAWPYRDWVVRALNADQPFDEFTIEQLAGDLLPNPTEEQLVATGFHRSAMLNLENGIHVDEQRVVSLLDRVNTTAAVWLGTTLQCAQCHNHKYDPFPQEDYYRLYAFFNGGRDEIEAGVGGYFPKVGGPQLKLYSLLSPPEQELAHRLEATLAETQEQIAVLTKELLPGEAAWQAAVLAGQAKAPLLIQEILRTPPEERSNPDAFELHRAFLASSPQLNALNTKHTVAKKKYEQLLPIALVMGELPEPRQTHVLIRGDFLQPGEAVSAGTPAVLPPLTAGQSGNRLDLARWLVSADNPLVARVTVNRIWREFFGRALVATVDDFGARGEPPTHPELLDWLATEFMRLNWSTKALHRLIVTSAAYRQSAAVGGKLLQTDPDNALYARGPRKRLPAEMIRDQALAHAGLLSRKMYGPPIQPYQPPGIWRQVDEASNFWVMSKGEDLYRRGVYVYWRRTSPYPSFVNFDAPTREVCTLEREPSITPLQALTTLNDPVYVEAAVNLAQRLLTDLPAGASDEERVALAFRMTTSRRPTAAEQGVLVKLLRNLMLVYENDLTATRVLCAALKLPAGADTVRTAAWIHLARAVLNLDETITSG